MLGCDIERIETSDDIIFSTAERPGPEYTVQYTYIYIRCGRDLNSHTPHQECSAASQSASYIYVDKKSFQCIREGCFGTLIMRQEYFFPDDFVLHEGDGTERRLCYRDVTSFPPRLQYQIKVE